MARGPFADLLAVAMVGVACFHWSRLVLAALWQRPTEVDVDVVHTVMGVSMAGMLTGWLTGAWNDAWMVLFACATAWFGWGMVRHLPDGDTARGLATHHLPHFVASAVMLYMLVAMRWTSMTGPAMGSMGHVGDSLLLPAVLAVLVVADAAIAAREGLLATPARAAVAEAAAAPVPDAPASVAGSTPPPGPAKRPVGTVAPGGTAACTLVMSVAMAYMLITVHP